MKKYNLIVLAGGEQRSLCEVTGHENKSQIPIHGVPMVGWVLDAFRRSGAVSEIVVAGPQELEALPCMKGVRKRVHGGGSALESLVNAVGYVKARLSSEEVHRGYLISFGDAVFLTKDVILEMVTNIENSDADIVLHYVERDIFAEAGLSVKRTFIPMGEGKYTGTTIYYVRRFRDILSCIVQIVQLRKYRKQPSKLLETLGCAKKTMREIEAHLSEALSVSVKIFSIARPEAGMDVDKPADLELARTWLADEASP